MKQQKVLRIIFLRFLGSLKIITFDISFNHRIMKFKILFGISFWIFLFAVSCKNEEISFDQPTKDLRFSKDTMFLDTIYNQVRSETYAVKVYNNENKNVSIPRIYLEGGASSPYRINVDGKAGIDFSNVDLRKKDSLYIFIEIAPIANAKEAIAEDRIVFENALGKQHVTLLSVVQDADFYIQSETNPNIITQNTTWTNNKAKIIYGDLTLAEGKTLDIQAGTKVYFTKKSGLKVSKNAQLNINGAFNNDVVLRGDRNDSRYDTIPMNWRGISLEQGATLNMKYARVFGGETGLALNNATANIENSFIHTFQEYGILAVNSTLKAKNVVTNNCGQAGVGIFKGGNVDLTHCTLANYWDLNRSMPSLGLYATNEWTENGTTQNGALTLNIKNSIVYSDKETSILFKAISGQTFNYLVQSSLIKYSERNSGFSFDTNPSVQNSIKNEDPKFLFPFVSKMNLRVKDDSPAKGKGSVSVANLVPQDIVGNSRTTSPTIGAYQ